MSGPLKRTFMAFGYGYQHKNDDEFGQQWYEH